MRIFISYRRSDSSAHAGRLYDHLVDRFGTDNVFMDLQTIAPGDDFVARIDASMAECDVAVIVIGREWLAPSGWRRRSRLHDRNDYVRREIERALNGGVALFPVLVNAATMPTTDELPRSLTGLARVNAIELSDSRWAHDVDRLIAAAAPQAAARSIPTTPGRPPADPGDLAPGALLAGHSIQSNVGRGICSVVYRAIELGANRVVALKVIPAEWAGDEGYRRGFLQEFETVAGIEHPALLPLHHAGEESGALWASMQLIDGCDLGQLIARRSRIPAAEAVRIVGEVAGALSACHERGLVHGNATPAKVLVAASDGRVHLAGLPATLDRSTRSDRHMTATFVWRGSLEYTPPEKILGTDTDARSDVYLLGLLLFEALSGRRPFSGDNPGDVMRAHLTQRAPTLVEGIEDVGPELDAVVQRALAKEPGERYSSPAEFAAAASSALSRSGSSD